MSPKTKSGGAEGAADPPPTSTIFVTYAILGSILSYAFGRDPLSGMVAPRNVDDVLKDMAPTFVALCLFLVSYSLYDAMGVGICKAKHGIGAKPYHPSMLTDVPEEVYIAQRVQTNQVEQLIPFIVASLSFSLFVNGNVGGILTSVWVLLRRGYARRYRSSVGLPLSQSGLSSFTIPAYFVMNAMLMGTVVQCTRCMLMS